MIALLLLANALATANPTAIMPRTEDYTLMYWAQGFPTHTPSAPWHRVIETGRYAFVLDTAMLQLPHLGPLPKPKGYVMAARAADRPWQSLPPAQLGLLLSVNGEDYRCRSGGPWSAYAGPRLIESGRFLQRADVTGLSFAAADGTPLNVEARLETVAWPDRLGLLFAARPGLQPISPGEASFGHVGGGFGLDGTNHLEIPHSPELDSEVFTLDLWAYVPKDYRASEKTFPWLVCKNHHEQAEGNYGIVILNGKAQARLNIGGGRENQFTLDGKNPLQIEAWNHLILSYDGDHLRFFVNDDRGSELQIGRKRVPGKAGLAFGRRQDNSGDGYHYRGVIDDIRVFDRALTPTQLRDPSAPKPVREFHFRNDGSAQAQQPRVEWKDAKLQIVLDTGGKSYQNTSQEGSDWREVGLFLDPVSQRLESATPAVQIEASEIPNGNTRPVIYDPARGWHQIDLNGIVPLGKDNDSMERIKLVLTNPTASEQTARLLFEKASGGFRQRIGSAITGMSAILRDANGHPTGFPVQLSKNWHNRPEGGVYSGAWFHGISQVHLPPSSSLELELSIVYGHWGGIAAASHAQLCLIGWGTNQLWDQSALGSWGESICYEPDQIQGQCSVLDVRPVMVSSLSNGAKWGWTNNVGGGDFFRFFDSTGTRVPHTAMRTAYERYGPCLTEVTYTGQIGPHLKHHETVSLSRTDDIVRGIYRLRLDVAQATDVSRLVLFQIGADTYSYAAERKIALGNETGLLRQWNTQWGGDTYRTEPIECTGQIPWISLHDAAPRTEPGKSGALANRGLVIRQWNARLGGKPASPWMAEHGNGARGTPSSTVDLIPPPGITRLEPGDFVEATVEHLIVPQFAKDYYGPSQSLRAALQEHENSWRMIHREAVGNERRVTVTVGKLTSLHPAVTIATDHDRAELTLTGGLGAIPLTFTGLHSPRHQGLKIDGEVLNQSVHGNDFWQTDYDPESATWSQTFTVPLAPGQPHTLQFSGAP